MAVLVGNPAPNTIFPSVDTPVQQVAQAAVKQSIPEKQNFRLFKEGMEGPFYTLSYAYEKNGQNILEMRGFVIADGHLYERKISWPDQYKDDNIAKTAASLIVGPVYTNLIGNWYDQFGASVIASGIDAGLCAQKTIIDNMRVNPATERYYDADCQIWRHR